MSEAPHVSCSVSTPLMSCSVSTPLMSCSVSTPLIVCFQPCKGFFPLISRTVGPRYPRLVEDHLGKFAGGRFLAVLSHVGTQRVMVVGAQEKGVSLAQKGIECRVHVQSS